MLSDEVKFSIILIARPFPPLAVTSHEVLRSPVFHLQNSSNSSAIGVMRRGRAQAVPEQERAEDSPTDTAAAAAPHLGPGPFSLTGGDWKSRGRCPGPASSQAAL